VLACRRCLLSSCVWSPRSALAVALSARPHAWQRRSGPSWSWPACITATAAPRVPHRAALASPSRHHLADGCPGLASTAPRGLGGQRARACCRVGVTHRPCSTYPARYHGRVRRPCHPPYFVSSTITALDPLLSPTLSVPSRVDLS
jgi:hypothetical protein